MSGRTSKGNRIVFRGVVFCGCFLLSLTPLLWAGGQDELQRRDPAGVVRTDSIETLQRMGRAFASVMERVSPAVVSIRSERTVMRTTEERAATPPLDPFSDEFFEYFFRRRPPREETPRRPSVQRSQGSGFVISADGCILTNNHVVADADKIEVELVDGRTMDANVVGTDPESDVAVVRIPADRLTPVALGDSDALEVGEWVLAVGNPLGLSHSVTAGIVSAKGRRGFNVATYENFIQTDAAVNMGNSGGPLVNLKGQAVGMNTFILGPAGGNIGIGFAIPINIAKQVADQLIRAGVVERGYLGLIPQDLTAELAEAFDLPGTKGALIAQVTENSAAARAGLAPGDIVPEFAGVAVDSAVQFRNLVASHRPGEQVPIVVLRAGGGRRTLDATLDRRPSADELGGRPRAPVPRPPEESARPLGLTVRDQPAPGGEPNVPVAGVVITKVASGSEAAQKGLREGYVIQEVNHQEIATEQQFREAVTRVLQEHRRLLLRVTDGRVSAYLVLEPTTE